MKFPFSKREKYFTSAEQKHLDDFLAVEPIGDDTWTNASGETRKVGRIEWPQGIDFGPGRTAYRTNTKTNTVEYHSPCATYAGKTARVMFFNADGSGEWCTSPDWLKWAGKSFTINQPVIEKKSEAQKAKEEALIGMAARSTAAPESQDEISKGAKWTKPRK